MSGLKSGSGLNSGSGKILVTGGLGFIGSHVVVKLFAKSFNIIILDNLSNSRIDVLDKIKSIAKSESESKDSNSVSKSVLTGSIEFIKGDIRDTELLNEIFSSHCIKTVLHFAALKSVGESQKYPELYHQVNVEGTIGLINAMNRYHCKEIIYSSSATVYGSALAPVNEETETGNGLSCNYAINKYDMEKHLIKMSKDKILFPGWKIIILRYFNPIGAHPSGKIGEDPNDIPNNIFPYLLRVAEWTNNQKIDKNAPSPYKVFTVFGDTYETRDGTCIRDYVHVQDLAQAHVDVLDKFDPVTDHNYNSKSDPGLIKVYNVGTGRGTTVLELIDALNRSLTKRHKLPIVYRVGEKRPGDLAISYAEVQKIRGDLGFVAQHGIDTMCEDGLNFVGL